VNEHVASHGATVRAARAFRFADRTMTVLVAAWRSLFRALGPSYRPEQHYMRGPGPKWRARNHQTFGAINSDLHRRSNNQSVGAAS
jgi:hypothetical protein